MSNNGTNSDLVLEDIEDIEEESKIKSNNYAKIYPVVENDNISKNDATESIAIPNETPITDFELVIIQIKDDQNYEFSNPALLIKNTISKTSDRNYNVTYDVKYFYKPTEKELSKLYKIKNNNTPSSKISPYPDKITVKFDSKQKKKNSLTIQYDNKQLVSNDEILISPSEFSTSNFTDNLAQAFYVTKIDLSTENGWKKLTKLLSIFFEKYENLINDSNKTLNTHLKKANINKIGEWKLILEELVFIDDINERISVLEHNFDNINKILSLKNDKTSSYNDFLKDYKTKFNDEKFNELRRLIDAAEESAKNSINNILSTKINELIKTEFKESNIKYNDKEIYLSNPTLRVIEDLTIFLNDFKQNFKGKYINNNINLIHPRPNNYGS